MSKDFEELKYWMEKRYGKANQETIIFGSKTYTGYMYGNDECFDLDEFYQYFLTEDALYKFYYEIPEGESDFGNLDYDHPYRIEDADAQYWIDYVI